MWKNDIYPLSVESHSYLKLLQLTCGGTNQIWMRSFKRKQDFNYLEQMEGINTQWNRISNPHPCSVAQWHQWVNSLAPGKFEWKYGYLNFQIISVTDVWGVSCEFIFRWMSLDLTDDKSTLVQVMAWCRQATSHYLSQCWPRSLSPYGVTRPQWIKAGY